MSADELVEYLTWLVYLAIFISVVRDAIHDPTRANINIAVFFGLPTLIILLNVAELPAIHLFESNFLIDGLRGASVLTLSFVLLRLVKDFADVSATLMRIATVGWLLLTAALFLFVSPRPAR